MRFRKSQHIKSEIPTAALPDIVFQLLLFFMLSSYFRPYQGLPVALPEALQMQKAPGVRNVVIIWVDANNNISVDDQSISVADLAGLLENRIMDADRPVQSISLRVDQMASMETVLAIQIELRQVGGPALNLHYSTEAIELDEK
ncbi:biopolymer transporter ExbD [candidate division KSB1 bacterium]|nr:biopolymer transporter ExbD [candidate division KSB1 bacterium]